MLNELYSQNAALVGNDNCIELRDRSHLCYKSIINYDLDITNILAVSPQVRYIEVFDMTNPRFKEQIWPVPSDFVKSRFHCTIYNPGLMSYVTDYLKKPSNDEEQFKLSRFEPILGTSCTMCPNHSIGFRA